MKSFSWIEKQMSQFFFELGESICFFLDSLKSFFEKPYRFQETLQSFEFIGNKSILVILLTGAFTGMVLAYQIYSGFVKVGTTNLVGPIVAISILQELGPVTTGLLISARAGGAMAAQIASMRTSEQIDSLEVLGVNPKQFLIAPRLIASFLATPLLYILFTFTAISGAYSFAVSILNLDGAIFLDKIKVWADLGDFFEGYIKASTFGVIFSTICTKSGFYASRGAKGVGYATNRGVVNSMVMIIIVDFFVTGFITLFRSFL